MNRTARLPVSLCPALCLTLVLLSGCAGVTVSTLSTREYMLRHRGDILSSGELSVHTVSALTVTGLSGDGCFENGRQCRRILERTDGLRSEKKLAALSELWLLEAMLREKRKDADGALNAYLETARHAYAYLFLSDRPMSARALEERPTQVRDYYNFAVRQTVSLLFDKVGKHGRIGPDGVVEAGRRILVEFDGQAVPHADALPESIYPASALDFEGLRNRYRRDGLGAEMVAAMPEPADAEKAAWTAMRYPTLTVLAEFPGRDLEEVLATDSVLIRVYDPYKTEQVSIRGTPVPLAGNFTAGYGLWLARSSFAVRSLATLFGTGDMLERPCLFLMQPYDPNRRTVIMVHGLASSPEAWINLANEIMGDEILVRNYQIWQIYYPTSHPIAINNHALRAVLAAALRDLDPSGTAQASRDMLLVGHSMGGILSRLMVSSSGNRLWNDLLERRDLDPKTRRKVRERLGDYLFFDPVPQIGRAVFIAAPHRGTPFADSAPARYVVGLVSLPVELVKGVIEPAVQLVNPELRSKVSMHSFNGIANLGSADPFILAAADLPVSPKVPFHSIIGNKTPNVPLADSDDGIVPYSSASFPGAASEKVIPSGHSVQETPEAALELRRIMHLHLAEHPY